MLRGLFTRPLDFSSPLSEDDYDNDLNFPLNCLNLYVFVSSSSELLDLNF